MRRSSALLKASTTLTSVYTMSTQLQRAIRAVDKLTVLASLLKLVFVVLYQSHLCPHATVRVSATSSAIVEVMEIVPLEAPACLVLRAGM
jgi:hypothetical protein